MAPCVTFDANDQALYTIAMIDPDAPTPKVTQFVPFCSNVCGCAG